jgi:hypothetical protein
MPRRRLFRCIPERRPVPRALRAWRWLLGLWPRRVDEPDVAEWAPGEPGVLPMARPADRPRPRPSRGPRSNPPRGKRS